MTRILLELKMSSDLVLNILEKVANQEEPQVFPLVGFCHSYDIDGGEENLRRIRVTYPTESGALAVSPLLFRVSLHPGSDPPVPAIGSCVFGFWLNKEKTEGIYLGVIAAGRGTLVDNFSQTKDWFEICPDGVVTIRAKTIRFVADEGIELMANTEAPNNCRIALGGSTLIDGPTSDITLQDGFGCEIAFREIYNAVKLDEAPELDA